MGSVKQNNKIKDVLKIKIDKYILKWKTEDEDKRTIPIIFEITYHTIIPMLLTFLTFITQNAIWLLPIIIIIFIRIDVK